MTRADVTTLAEFATLGPLTDAQRDLLLAAAAEIRELREAITGRPVSCEACNGMAKRIKNLQGWIKWREAWTGAPSPRDLHGVRWDVCALRGDAAPSGFLATDEKGALP